MRKSAISASVFLALALNFSTFSVRAALDFFEPFAYNFTNGVKQNITNFPAYSGSNYWALTGTITNIVLTNFTLSVPGLLNGAGNAVAAGPPVGSSGLRRLLIDPATSKSNSYSAGVVYFSVALQVTDRASRSGSDDWHTAGSYSILGALGNGANANGFLSIVGLQQLADTNTYVLGVSKAANTGVNVVSDAGLHSNDVVFVVGRYTFNPGASDDECALWINPTPDTFGAVSPPSGALIATAGTDVAAPIDRFNFRCTTSGAHVGSPNQVVWDELRFGGTWADVTPPAPASSPSLNVTRSGSTVVLSWPTTVSGFGLQSTDSLSPTAWVDDTNSVAINNGTNTVTETMTTSRFFRLKK